MLMSFLTSLVGLATIACYGYVAVMFGRASHMAGHMWPRVIVDALTWPVMGWKAIKDLYDS